jgi:hypothetical protein
MQLRERYGQRCECSNKPEKRSNKEDKRISAYRYEPWGTRG